MTLPPPIEIPRERQYQPAVAPQDTVRDSAAIVAGIDASEWATKKQSH